MRAKEFFFGVAIQFVGGVLAAIAVGTAKLILGL